MQLGGGTQHTQSMGVTLSDARVSNLALFHFLISSVSLFIHLKIEGIGSNA